MISVGKVIPLHVVQAKNERGHKAQFFLISVLDGVSGYLYAVAAIPPSPLPVK
jgi:hypothetical protein